MSRAAEIAKRARYGTRPVKSYEVPAWLYQAFFVHWPVKVMALALCISLVAYADVRDQARAGAALCAMPLASLVVTQCEGCTQLEKLHSDMAALNYDFERAIICDAQ